MEQHTAVMNCPDEVADVILSILNIAILSIRWAGGEGDAEFCRIQANHIHNLPGLLRNYHCERLRSYLKWGRARYLRDVERMPGAAPVGFAPLWQRLEDFLAAEPADQERQGGDRKCRKGG